MTVYHQTIHAYCRAISTLDADAYVACFAADCELNDPAGAPPAHGQGAAREFFSSFLPLLNKIQFRAGHIYVGGRQAAFSWTIEAEGKKGQLATADGIDVFEFDAEGKIVRNFGYWDPGPFVATLAS
jgi:ketosteroid isomerase-like protein